MIVQVCVLLSRTLANAHTGVDTPGIQELVSDLGNDDQFLLLPERRSNNAAVSRRVFKADRLRALKYGDRCKRVPVRLGLPIGILTALGGVLSIMAAGYSYQRLKWPFLVVLIVACCGFAVSILFLALAYHRQETGYLQRLGELEQAYKDLQSYDQKSADETFDEYLRRSIIAASDLNADANDRRSGYLYRARIALLVVTSVTAVLGILYVSDRVNMQWKPVVPTGNRP